MKEFKMPNIKIDRLNLCDVIMTSGGCMDDCGDYVDNCQYEF